jgi:hypothetical protein
MLVEWLPTILIFLAWNQRVKVNFIGLPTGNGLSMIDPRICPTLDTTMGGNRTFDTSVVKTISIPIIFDPINPPLIELQQAVPRHNSGIPNVGQLFKTTSIVEESMLKCISQPLHSSPPL